MGRGRWLLVVSLLVIGALLAGCGSAKDGTQSGQQDVESASRFVFTMGTSAQLTAYGSDPEAALDAVQAELDRLTTAFDRFTPGSDIDRVNKAIGEWVEVDRETVAVVQSALELAKLTDGAFDPTVAPLVDLWGFVEDPHSLGGAGSSPTVMRGEEPPADAEIRAILPAVGYEQVEVDEKASRLKLTRDGAELDLGGVAKGYATDRAVAILKEHGVESGLVNLGGDMFALGAKPNGKPWRVGVQHPRLSGEEYIAILNLVDQAVVTSGDYQRYFEYEGKRYTHLIDPRTGYPQQGLASVTVVAPSGTQADALATAVAVMGMEEGYAFLESLLDVGGVLVGTDLEVRVTTNIRDQVELRGVDF